MQNGYLMYDFSTPGFLVRATSGAPVLNQAGEVVAINLGGGPADASGKMFGVGNPASAWSSAVVAACTAAP